jgi:hypothetical protein
MTYDEAVALLHRPERWCDAAAALVELKDARAIGPLFEVVALTTEGLPDRACVRDALDRLGVRREAARLVGSAQVAERRTAVRMMKAFPGDEQVAVLARVALGDADADLRGDAARAVRTQPITAAWDTAMVSLLDAGDAEIRTLAASTLERRFGAPVLAALRKRLAAETEPAVRAALEAAIKIHVDHAGH